MVASDPSALGETSSAAAAAGAVAAAKAAEHSAVTTELPPEPADEARVRRDAGRRDAHAKRNDRSSDEVRQPRFAPARRPGRRVVRVVRHVQLWSVFKVALLGGLVFYAIFLGFVALGWSLANSTGQVHHIEHFMRQIGFENWSFNGPHLFDAAALVGAVWLVVGSILITLGAAIVNLIAEATGGLRFVVIEVDEPLDEDDEDVAAHR